MKSNLRYFVIFLTLSFFCANCGKSFSKDFRPGEIIPEESLKNIDPNYFFQNTDIPDSVFALMQGKSFKSDCTLAREDLRYLTCLHRDAEGRTLVGEMVLSKKIADTVLSIFRQLYDASYPIERMVLIDNYDADDELSMEADNSSAFNFRFVSHTTTVSVHGRGLAVDINPLYNPYHKILKDGTEVIEPYNAREYLDRSADFPYKITRDDLCCRLFIEAGFEWGGDWTSCKDYQHFEYKGSSL